MKASPQRTASSLSMRLGLTVSLMGAGLVLLLATLAYLALSHELGSLARESLDSKLEQIRHTLTSDLKTGDIAARPHSLLDLVMGHDNLHLSIFGADPQAEPLLNIGNRNLEPLPVALTQPESPAFLDWLDSAGNRLLSTSSLISLRNGEQVRVVLSLDRANDQALLSAYLRSTVIALPLLLMLIGIGAWWVVQRGLAPLQQFSRVAAKVTTQDLTHRLSPDNLPRELAELAHSINFMLHRLDGGVQQLSQFSDDLAHELRSPITNLMGKAQVTLSRERPPHEYKAVLESSTEELERLTRIVSDMLFLAQVSHPASQVAFEEVSLGEEARRVTELFALSAEEKHLGISLSGDGLVYGDRLMIQRAISNLLSNAIRHSPRASSISILVEEHDSSVSLSVGNPGAGIPEQHLAHLFERFYRVDSSRSRAEGGTGLGLAIVRSIMNLHQGRTEVSSVPGSFTLFRLVFTRLNHPPRA
ncbi:heavy metal sensor histidine kinase [Pseudomonas chlororaphis]|uniref:heavy metal sensor histidine kinase n=1 Tax=Pseudomonas chlororaphis TaxID=587753 RepID=UPI0006A5A6F4|nr:heavy metal sensor histidine kinase [Pseudomonas chlororaphis]AZC30935.1 Heavy metal sensor histidine kinase [Pseudomonas chlororaphis subsp. piscium]WDG78392.1 heavy metal sensor histidine kinase [Pseudomonas chlororaphis]WDG88557.1 heavy metal sensor histidine kinase [Pseudomonas chlororaphis]WDG94814.1 heavy metal sensor histidine kinase [Pseudomonas chlororaphis]SDT05123.1 two-component system, OmpR family, heavy metal sensor histidine kinase CusS [Pseudomonas chlororaphis]